jgi:hypothetical protein
VNSKSAGRQIVADRSVWLYAVGAGLDGAWVDGLRGVDGEAVRPVSAAGLTALVGAVDREAFGVERLRARLDDLDQLATMARAHHRVIRVVADHQAVAPARLATIYDDFGRVREMLVEHAAAFRAALRRVAGRHEWGVKIFAAPEKRPTQPIDRPPSGTAYLRQRRDSLAARDTAVAGAGQVHADLAGTAVAARQRPPQDPNLSGDRRRMLLNATYLVEDAGREAFVARVPALARKHPDLAVELTGPWPPYSFAAIEEGEPA